MTPRIVRILEWTSLLVLLPGVITLSMRGSVVDITVRLNRMGRFLELAGLVLIGLGVAFAGMRVVTAFATGRVAQIVEQQKHDHPCSAIYDSALQQECLRSLKAAVESEDR